MVNPESRKAVLLAALLGAMAGGVFVAVASQAVPKMMAGMMTKVMAEMGAQGCNPAEMCQQMMAQTDRKDAA